MPGSVPHDCPVHTSDVIMGMMTSQITSLTTVYTTIYSIADQRKHQSSASLAFVQGIHRWPANSPHKGPVTRKMLPFDDVSWFSTTAVFNEEMHYHAGRNLSLKCTITYCIMFSRINQMCTIRIIKRDLAFSHRICTRISMNIYWISYPFLNFNSATVEV